MPAELGLVVAMAVLIAASTAGPGSMPSAVRSNRSE